MIRTCWPAWIPPARRHCNAVTAASGTAAGSSKVRLPGLAARQAWWTAMYSAKAPWPKPYTARRGLRSAPGKPQVSTLTNLTMAKHGKEEVSCRARRIPLVNWCQ